MKLLTRCVSKLAGSLGGVVRVGFKNLSSIEPCISLLQHDESRIANRLTTSTATSVTTSTTATATTMGYREKVIANGFL